VGGGFGNSRHPKLKHGWGAPGGVHNTGLIRREGGATAGDANQEEHWNTRVLFSSRKKLHCWKGPWGNWKLDHSFGVC